MRKCVCVCVRERERRINILRKCACVSARKRNREIGREGEREKEITGLLYFDFCDQKL
jgi:hypothetical protein